MSSAVDDHRRRRHPPPCSHLSDYRSNVHGLAKPLGSLHTCLRIRPLSRADISRDPHEIPRCAYCPRSSSSPSVASPSPRLYACLACAVVTCPAHAAAHGGGRGSSSSIPGHEIAVDVDRAELFCCACGDQVYDPNFDAAVLLAIAQWAPLKSGEEEQGNAGTSNVSNAVARRKRRRRVDQSDYSAAVESGGGGGGGSSSNSGSGVEESFPRGLRGMNNLGNTCFMSSVLQALMHTPPMRNYFLSDLHNRFACQQKGRRKKSGGNGGGSLCLACDLDAMYSAVFSGDRTPYSPAKFLYR